ncbi:MAG: STAS domain-containing protein [Candidatus Omnitrophica bacterium]|nr:STAS domain-containing protein [Candidatus Omnitrophota bacterium]
MPLRIDITKKEEGVFLVSLLGSLDSNTYLDFEADLKPILISSTKALILDLANLNYISSMGVSAILKIKRILEEQGGSLVMTNLQPQIKTVFDIIKALPSMRVFESIQEADRYLTEIQRKEISKGEGSL